MDGRKVAQIGPFLRYMPYLGFPYFRFWAEGVVFPLFDVLVPLYGIPFAPKIVVLSILLGTFIGRPVIFLGLNFLPGLLATFSLSHLVRGRKLYFLVFMADSITLFNINRFVTPFD